MTAENFCPKTAVGHDDRYPVIPQVYIQKLAKRMVL